MADENEDDLLRSVALQNAQAVLLARQRAEQELIQAKEALEQTTEELAHAKELFQNVFDQAAVGIARIDATGRWLMVNPRLCEVLGYTPEELLAVRLPQLAHPDDVAADSEMMPRLLSGEALTCHREKRYLRKDGTVVWVSLTLSVERETARAADRSFIAVIQDITERKHAEEALQRTQALNQAVLGSLAANIAVLDREGGIIAVNEAWKRFACENDGAAVAESVGINYLRVCRDSPESKDGGRAALNGIQAVLDGTLPNFVFEYPCHSPSEKRWFLMSVTPLLGERGGAVVTHTDITKLKRIEEALQESEERLELAMEAGRIGTFEWNIRTNAVVWTEQSKTAFARPSRASRGVYDDWARRIRPEDLLVCEARIQEVFRKKQHLWQAEYRMISFDTAEEGWISSQGHIFYDAQGEPLRMVGVNIDISERKRIERTLQESEERFRLTIDEAPIGMALVALDGRFVRVNRALCEIVGYSPGELTGLTFQAITHPDDLDADLALKGQLARGEIPRYQLDKRYIRKDGTIVDILLSVSILRNREGAPLYYIVQIEDITERKRAEDALQESERRLTLALDSAQMGMWDLDLLTDTSVRSLRHDQIFGYSAAIPTWGAAIFMTHVVPEDREVAKRAFEKAFESDSFDMECRILWADESIHWISAKGRVYRNPKGDPMRMMGTMRISASASAQKRRCREANASFGSWPSPCRRSSGPPQPMG